MRKLFIECIENGDVDQLQVLLKKDRTLATRKENGDTMLHKAVQNRNIAIISLLLDYGAQHNPNRSGQTPLHLAATYGLVEIMQALLERGATIDEVDDNGESPLYIAVKHAGQMMAYHFSDTETCDRFFNAVNLLLKWGADTNLANKQGETPLLAASWYGNVQLTQLLLCYFADVNKANNKGESPLFAAAARGHLAVVEILLDNQAKINQADKEARTPVYMAQFYGHIVVAELLEEVEVRVSQENSRSIASCADFFSPANSQCPRDSEDDSDSDDFNFSPVAPYSRRHSS